jgi:hypothetical protein
MINKQRCGEKAPGASSQKKVGDGKTYGDMKKTDGHRAHGVQAPESQAVLGGSSGRL